MDKEKNERIDETFNFKLSFLIPATIISTILLLFVLFMIHMEIWRNYQVAAFTYTNCWIIIIELLILPFLHEYIHAITYMKLGKLPKSSVQFICNFPINLAVHYTEIVPINVRRWSCIMPNITICSVLLIIGLSLNNIYQTLFAGLMLSGGISDMYNFYKLRNYKSDCLTEDMPKLTGCIVYKPK